MSIYIMKKIKFLMVIVFIQFLFLSNTYAEYPNTSIGVINLNLILTDSKVAIDADKQIQEISSDLQERLTENEKELLDQLKKLNESQQILAPEAFDQKRIEYEKKVQDFQIRSQEQLVKLDKMVADVRAKILDEIKPILEEISNEKGITVILEKSSVILNADNMDITKLVIKELNKNLSKIKVELEE